MASYFVLDQFIEFPGVIAEISNLLSQGKSASFFAVVAPISRILTMIGIVTIGILLFEYMNDGTINNRVFNGVCIATVALFIFNLLASTFSAIAMNIPELWLESFNVLYRITMIFLLTFFAYDSKKHQLKKTNLN